MLDKLIPRDQLFLDAFDEDRLGVDSHHSRCGTDGCAQLLCPSRAHRPVTGLFS